MRTSKVLIAVFSLVALCGAANASELVISLQVEAAYLDDSYVGDVPVQIWAESLGTGLGDGWEQGIWGTDIDIISLNGVSTIKTLKGAPVIAWDAVVASNFFTIKPAVTDLNADGVMDAEGMSFSDASGNQSNYWFGFNGAELVATQTWTKAAAGQLKLGVVVDPLSRYYDWVDPMFPGSSSSQYDLVTGQGINDVGPDDDDDTTDPTAEEVIPAAKTSDDRGEWQGPTVWGDPTRWLELTAADKAGAPAIDEYEWDFTKDGGPALVKTGQSIIITLGELMGAGWELATWDDVNKEFVGGIVSYKLTLTQGGNSSEATSSLFIPEPATLTLIGFGALALIRRRRS